MNESKFRSKVCATLREMGCVVIPIVGSAAGGCAWPDTVILRKGTVYFVEFKGEKTELRLNQKYRLQQLKDKGGNVFVLRYVTENNYLGVLQDHAGNALDYVLDVPHLLVLLEDWKVGGYQNESV